jgi:hypothetical protein
MDMCSLWMVGGVILAGVGAGVASLAIGGMGARLTTTRILRSLAESVEDLHGRVDREVKRRASEAGVAARGRDAELVELLAARARTGVPPAPTALTDRSAVRAEAKRRGLM